MPVLAVKDAPAPALEFAQGDAGERVEVIVLENVKTNVCSPAKTHALQPAKARAPLLAKAHVTTPARRDVLLPAEIPASWYAQAPVPARVAQVAAMDAQEQRHCSKSMTV